MIFLSKNVYFDSFPIIAGPRQIDFSVDRFSKTNLVFYRKQYRPVFRLLAADSLHRIWTRISALVGGINRKTIFPLTVGITVVSAF